VSVCQPYISPSSSGLLSAHPVSSWFAYISPTEPCLLEDVLVAPKHSLVKQVADHYIPKLLPHEHDQSAEDDAKARNFVFNIDGLGVACER
jgi:glutamine amidotransferase